MSSINRSSKKSAGAFDIRNVIGALIGLYGIILLIAYFVLDPGINPDTGVAKEPVYNLYTGIGLVVVALVFFVWAKIRPTVVEDAVVTDAAAADAVAKGGEF